MNFERNGNIKAQLNIGKFRDEKIVELLQPFQMEFLNDQTRRKILFVLQQYFGEITEVEVIDSTSPIDLDMGVLVFDVEDRTTKPYTYKRINFTNHA